jgi:hypothetical protein
MSAFRRVTCCTGAVAAPTPEQLRQKAEAAAAKIVAKIREEKVGFLGKLVCSLSLSREWGADLWGAVQAQSEDVVINDEPLAMRDQLTRRSALTSVEQQTGTCIVVKGRYYPPGAPRDSINPPLHLHVTAAQHLGPVCYKRLHATKSSEPVLRLTPR